VTTVPTGANVVLTGGDGMTVSGQSPFATTIASGTVAMVITAAGRVTRSETFSLTRPVDITRWLDPAGQILVKRYEVKTGANPKQVSFTPDGSQMWVPLLGSRGVDVFDTASGTKLGLVSLGTKGGAVEVIFTLDGTRAYVSQMETASVYEIDTSTRRVLRSFATGGNWTKVLALSADEKTLWAANWVSDDVSEIDLTSGRLKRRMRTVDTPRGLMLDPSGTALWVAGFEGGELARLDLATGKSSVLLATGGAMRHIVIDKNTQRLYADDMGRDMAFTIDLAAPPPLKVVPLAKTDSHPNTIDISPDGRLLFVSNRGQNSPDGYNQFGPEWGTVVVFDTASGRRLDAVVSGNQTTGLDVSDDGRLLAYTDFMDHRLVVYEIPPTETFLSARGGYSAQASVLLVKKKKS
jgi:DNA-binding beta-propeller fold protein YncE